MILRTALVGIALALVLGTSSSAQMPPAVQPQHPPSTGPLITLYSRDLYNGPSLKVEGITPDVHVKNFPYPTASFVVNRGRWILCSGRMFTGLCVTVGVGMYPAAFANGFAQSIISLRPVN
ncbi:MAG: beta/gamma crystallin-related protein [Vulcanimicrobiaceae bacterium]|jgi:hypothetical protein